MNASTLGRDRPRPGRLACLGLLSLGLLCGCGSLLPKAPAQPALFVLEDTAPMSVGTPGAAAVVALGATLIIDDTRAASGYGTRQIAYVRAANELEYFAFSQWVDPPAVMLGPLLVRAIERTGAFQAVVRVPTSVAADLRLDTEIVRLQQDFTSVPSRVRLTLRAVLIDTATRRVVAWREFDAEAVASSEDPPGGVVAANQVVRRVLVDVGAFCAEWISKPTRAVLRRLPYGAIDTPIIPGLWRSAGGR